MNVGMHHTGVYCRDIEESIAFYCELLGFKHLFSTLAMEGDKPLKMAWIKSSQGVIIELLEQEDKSPVEAASKSLNHLAIRIEDMESFVCMLTDRNISIEAGPFDALCEFDRPLSDEDNDIFTVYGKGGAKLKIMFFRGPGGERIEAVQDDIGALD